MEWYDDSKPSKYITYLDAKYLYGWAMSQYLPYDEISCLTQPEFNNLAINLISEDSPYVCLLEVGLEYTDNHTI